MESEKNKPDSNVVPDCRCEKILELEERIKELESENKILKKLCELYGEERAEKRLILKTNVRID